MESPLGFGFSPQLMPKQSFAPRLSPVHSVSPRAKRKRSPDDIDMESPGHNSQSLQTPIVKRIRNLPTGRPLPLARLLHDLDKSGLQELVKSLCERHPGLSNEVYKHAPKPSVSQALSTLSQLERNVQTSFPFGGDVRGEYAYNRVLPSIKDLLCALMDYVPHFLPPNEEHALETLQFLDGATGIISRLPDWTNANHSLAKREAYEEMNGAWIQGFREAGKKGAGVGAMPYLQKLRHWNEISDGALESVIDAANEDLGWSSPGKSSVSLESSSPLSRLHTVPGLFSM